MKKFSFKLEKLLRVREIEEMIAKRDFAKKNEEFLFEVNKLKGLFDSRKKTIEEFKTYKTFEINRYKIYMSYVEKLRLDIDLQRIKVSKKEVELNKERKKLNEAIKNKKIIEKLKEKKKDEYLLEFNAEEMKFIDEIALRKNY